MANERQVQYGNDVRNLMKEGIDLVANTVKITLGPRGRNVALDTNPYGTPLNTNDGVTIAQELHIEGKFQNMGAKLIREVAAKTNDVAGDGTTTASLLMQTIVTEGMKALSTGADAVSLRQGIEKAAAAVIAAVEEEKTVVKDLAELESIATISCGSALLGELIAKVVHTVGAEGLVTFEDSQSAETTSDISEGLELRGGYQIPLFINQPSRQQAQLDNVPIFVTNHSLTNGLEVVKLMEAAAGSGAKQAIVIANAIEGEALASCAVNWAQGKFHLLPIRVVTFGAAGEGVLRDVAAATGATFFAKEEGHTLPISPQDSIDFKHFGFVERVVATKDRTTLLGGDGDIEGRIKELKAQLPNLKAYEAESTKERIAKLQSGVGVIHVGGDTDSEREERKLRVEDAINACKAALEDGVVAGGGAALYRGSQAAAKVVEGVSADSEAYIGYRAVLRACAAPLRQMAANSGFELDRSDLVDVTDNQKHAIDFKTGLVVDAHKAGIIDPLKVVVSSLRFAASAAGLFLTTEAGVVSADEGEKI